MTNEYQSNISSSRITSKEMEYSILPEQEGDDFCSYRAMWRGVITQALMDAGSNSAKIEMKKEKARAISWLSGLSDDFEEVCDLAGLSPDYVKKKAKEAIANGCKWRVENVSIPKVNTPKVKISKVKNGKEEKEPKINLGKKRAKKKSKKNLIRKIINIEEMTQKNYLFGQGELFQTQL